jgi:hypothetical protein
MASRIECMDCIPIIKHYDIPATRITADKKAPAKTREMQTRSAR